MGGIIYQQWVPFIASTETLYSKLPAQVYAALQIPRVQGPWIWQRRVERETVQVGCMADKWVRSSAAGAVAGKDGSGWDRRWGKSIVNSG